VCQIPEYDRWGGGLASGFRLGSACPEYHAGVASYADDCAVGDARVAYFEANGFGADGGYAEDWVRLRVGPIPVVFPNTASRKAAVPCHDLHHVATGYDTDLVGEAEIGAWEIASGCAHVRAALVLNMLVIWPVLFFAPARVYHAFVRGRHTKNLYDAPYDDSLLEGDVGALRQGLGLHAPTPRATAADKAAFSGWIAVVVGLQVAIVLVFFGIPAWLLGAFD